MEQTALTYLIDKLELKVLSQHMPFVDNIISEALKMEKQQILYAYECGFFDPQSNKDLLPLEGSEQYFKETYESND